MSRNAGQGFRGKRAILQFVMKKVPILLALALLCVAGLQSCDKDNPQRPNRDNPVASELRSAAFEITLRDCEKGYSRDSNYVFEVVWKDGAFRFGLQQLDEMTPNIRPDGKNSWNSSSPPTSPGSRASTPLRPRAASISSGTAATIRATTSNGSPKANPPSRSGTARAPERNRSRSRPLPGRKSRWRASRCGSTAR